MLGPIQHHNKIIKYKPWPIEEEKLDEILYAALYSPSERGNRDWEVVTVTKPEIRHQLSLAAPDAFFINTAPVILTLCSAEWDRWIEDVSTAEENIYLEAINQGLSPDIIFLRDYKIQNGLDSEDCIRGLLQIPENIRIHSLISLGYPEQTQPEQTPIVMNVDKLHREGW